MSDTKTRTLKVVAVLVTVGTVVAATGGVLLASSAVDQAAPSAGDPVPADSGAAVQQQQGQVTVSNLSAPANVSPGDTINVSATILGPDAEEETTTTTTTTEDNETNTTTTEDGGAVDNETVTATVTYRFDGDVLERKTLRMDATESREVTFRVTIPSDAAPGRTVHGVYANETATIKPVTVLDSLRVSALRGPSSALGTDTIEVTARITNPNPTQVNDTVAFWIGDRLVEQRSVTMTANSSGPITFSVSLQGIEKRNTFYSVLTTGHGEVKPLRIRTMGGDQRTASVTFGDQTSNGSTVVVESVNLSEGGFVAIRDTGNGTLVGPVLGVSDFLEPGEHENVTVTLDEPLTERDRLTAVVHRDTDDDGTFSFRFDDGEEVDAAYTRGGIPIFDASIVNVTGEAGATTTTTTTTTPGNETTTTPGNETTTTENGG